jgi:hypothetical protein
MTCPRCRAENRDGARFCRECGATFAAVCAACGARAEAGSKFCDSCGAPLAATSVQPTATSRFASPESYTPKHLAERILTSKVALEGERKQVTVLFADLKGSMELLADRDPEEARKLLDPVLEHMMEAVHRYEGTVNQVMGDGIMTSSARRSPTRITRSARAMRPSTCRQRSAGMPRGSGARTASRSTSGSGSTPGKSSFGRSAPTYGWTIRPSAKPPISPPAWSSWPVPEARGLGRVNSGPYPPRRRRRAERHCARSRWPSA